MSKVVPLPTQTSGFHITTRDMESEGLIRELIDLQVASTVPILRGSCASVELDSQENPVSRD
ncbi:uncharacterized protein [Physcomitrium patens]|uniref:Uncharacterized protein n=1 Tax=Physcomitrium patens TaxID=3218 RepID=A0A7I4BL52_PHYPA